MKVSLLKIKDDLDLIEKQLKSKVNRTSHTFNITKTNNDRQIAFGFAMFSRTADGKEVVDLQGDSITPEELETLAYEYVKNGRDVGQLHETSGEGCVVESMVFTEDKLSIIGIPPKTVPIAWWVGLYIADPSVWALVKNGTYKAFSIEGTAERIEREV